MQKAAVHDTILTAGEPLRLDENSRDDLLATFAGAREALPHFVAAKESSHRFHRVDPRSGGEALPACHNPNAHDGWLVVETDMALKAGVGPCRSCWESVFQFLAREPTSPVEYRAETSTPTEPDVHLGEPTPEGDTSRPPRLLTLTDQVMINGGERFHAPAEPTHGEGVSGLDGDHDHDLTEEPSPSTTLCGRSDCRLVDREAVTSHYAPCRRCFDVDALE